jgi:hypothetical protein
MFFLAGGIDRSCRLHEKGVAMPTLNEIGRKFGTDKSSFGKQGGAAGAGHDYLRIYEKFLTPYRDTALKVLEIGVQRGASLKTWEEFFPKAQIYGLDINPDTLKLTGGRIETRLVDQSDAAALTAFAQECGPFDVVIEDGSHIWSHQITSIKALISHVKPGGVYIVEDLNTSQVASFGSPGERTGVDFLLLACRRLVSDGFKGFPPEDNGFMRFIVDTVDYVSVLHHSAAFFLRD